MPDSQKMREVAEEARRLGKDPAEAMRQEALRQGYTRGVEPLPPTRMMGEVGDAEREQRRREKARTGGRFTMEDIR